MTLFVAAGGGSVSDLYTVDPDTAVCTSVGPTGYALTGLAWDSTTSTMFGATSNSDPGTPRALVTVDIVTGAATLVAVFTVGGVAVTRPMTDISVANDGTLYAINDQGQVYTVNKATGAATAHGTATPASQATLEYASDGLFSIQGVGTRRLYEINPSTWARTELAAGLGGSGPASMSTSDAGVTYWVGLNSGVANLYTITSDGITTIVALVGALTTGIDAIAFNGVRGAFLSPPLPTDNDDFANALTITGASGSDSTVTNNSTYSLEGGEQVGANLVGGTARTAWYSWTAPATGMAQISTAGSTKLTSGDMNTQIAVWTGSVLGSLTEVNSADVDANETLRFPVVGGTTYKIQVGSADTGSYVVGWSMPAAPVWTTPAYVTFEMKASAGALADDLYYAQWDDSRFVNVSSAVDTYSHTPAGSGIWLDSPLATARLLTGTHETADTWYTHTFAYAYDGGRTIDGDGGFGPKWGFPASAAVIDRIRIGWLGPEVLGTVTIRNVRLGSTPGGNEYADDPTERAYTYEGYVEYFLLPPPSPTSRRFYESPPWRFVVTDLASRTLTFLDKRDRERSVTFTLDEPTVMAGTAPSGDPEINIVHTDGFPFLSEGNRLLYCFRRDGIGRRPWVIRAAGYLLDVKDQAGSNTAATPFQAWDSWQLLYRRPALNDSGAIPAEGFSELASRGDEIALKFLYNTVIFNGQVGLDFPGGAFYTGTVEATEVIPEIQFQAGVTVGEVWAQLCATDTMDIVITPVYDPSRRPGIVGEFNVFQRAGSARYDAIFAWDKPGRSVVNLEHGFNGNERTNKAKFYIGQGGPPVPLQTDAASVARYGEYWLTQFFPAQDKVSVVTAMAQRAIRLNAAGLETFTLSPAAERSPIPLTDYGPGDYVRIAGSPNMRQAADEMRRVQGISLAIADNQLESVSQLLLTTDEPILFT